MLQIGIIGMGIRGKMYAETIGQNHYAEVKSVSDANAKTVDETAKTFSVNGYNNYMEMIDAGGLDAVIVATPDHMHREAVVYAAEHGLNILVEKPFATTEEDSNAMVEAIEKNGVQCMVAFENRWNLPIAAAKDRIGNESFGDVLNVNARLNNTISTPTVKLPWLKNTGVGWFLYPHILDMTMWFTGYKKVKQVYCVGTKKRLASMGYNIYDTLQSTISFEDETNSTLSSTCVLPKAMMLGYDLKLEVVGSHDALYVNTFDQCVQLWSDTKIQNVHSLSEPLDGRLTGCPSYMTHHFIDCLRLNKPIDADYKKGAINTKIICALHRSADNGGEIIKF